MKGDIHVLPINDLREHQETRHCWCDPQVQQEEGVDVEAVVIHNSMDGRELIEQHGLQ